MFASGKNAVASANSEPRARRGEAERCRPRPRARAASRPGRTGAPRRPSPTRPRRARRGAGGRFATSEQRLRRARPGRRCSPPCGARLGKSATRRRARSAVGRRCGLATSAPLTVSRMWRGRSGRSVSSGGAPCWMLRDVSDEVAAPERMLAGERLPEDDAERPRRRRPPSRAVPAAARARCRRASRGCRRARSACRTRPSARARSRGGARRSPLTRRAARSTASRRGGRSRGGARARARRRSAPHTSSAARSSSSPARSASRIVRPGHVLVGDVDVGRVAREREDALAARVAERGAARASRSARWPLLPSRATIFRATSRPLFSSRASQTWPIPPEPRGRIGLYRPRKSSCARAGWDTLGFYGAAGAFPLRPGRMV